ncbi:MAG: TonB-dependent receptor [Prevotellaceae bacterium]|nr:TonB-dependent receptor [Prevotellaceae bacterium]
MKKGIIMRMTVPLRVCALLLLALFAVSAWGQKSKQERQKRLMSDSVFQIHEVVARGSQNVSPHQTISRKQISALASNNVADALKYLAGVQIKDYGGLGGQKTVNVRSLGSQHVGVYLDGVRITNAQNGTVDLGKYSLTTLESVSLFNANKTEPLMTASEYASASTVYLKTHRPDSTSLLASYSYGSFNTHKVNLTYSYKQLGFIDAQYTHTDGDYRFRYHTEYEDTTGTRRNDNLDQMRIEGCLFYGPWQWHTYYYLSYRGLPGGIVRRLSDQYTDVGKEWDQNFFSQLSYQHHFGLLGLRGIVKYANDRLHYRSDFDENVSVHSNVTYHQQDIYSAVALSYTYHHFGISLSPDLRWSDLTTDLKHFHYVYRIDSKTSITAFYNLGGLSVNATALYTYCKDHTYKEAAPLHRWTWDALASYRLGGWTLRAFYKTVFRIPTLNDLYYTLVGNRFLKPEYTQQWDAGVTYTHGWLHVQWDAYFNHVKDRIVCLPLKGSFQWSMLNYGYTRCIGTDLSVNATFKHHIIMFSGTYMDDRNHTNPGGKDYNDFVAYSPRWSFSAIYTFLWKGWEASVSDMFVDKRYWTAQNSIDDPLGRYNCTDVKVGYHYRMMTVEAECQNLFDKPYEMIQRWPMPGRRYAVTVKVAL